VDNQGDALAVRFQPISSLPPGVSLPPDTVAARVFSLDLYRYESSSNSAQRIVYSEGHSSPPIVLKWRLSAEDYALTIDGEDAPHPERLALFRLTPDGQIVKVPAEWDPEPYPYGTLTALFVDRSTFVLAVLPPGPPGQSIPSDPRYFRETGYRINRDDLWRYFQDRGGLHTFGFPISREFTLLGFDVQLFQRGAMQAQPDGSVRLMNLLQDDLMPFTRINSSVFPAADPDLIEGAPQPAEPDYAEQAVAFLQSHVSNQWGGLPVGFFDAYLSAGRADSLEDASHQGPCPPPGHGDPRGLPTSRPAHDPGNHNFVYQRFQRGILHYDAGTRTTQGLLLGDYFKGVLLGRGLPPDLEEQLRDSRFYCQYDRGRSGHLAKPQLLPGSSLVGAFEMDVPLEPVSPEGQLGVRDR